MKNVEATLRLALEIIQDINMNREPNAEAVRKLGEDAWPKPDKVSLDAWACDAIEEALRKKKAARTT